LHVNFQSPISFATAFRELRFTARTNSHETGEKGDDEFL